MDTLNGLPLEYNLGTENSEIIPEANTEEKSTL